MSASGWAIWHQSISRHGIDLIPWSCLRWKHWSNATLVAGVKSYKHKSNAVSDNGWMYFSTRSSADTAFITPHAHSTDEIIDYTYLNTQIIFNIWYNFVRQIYQRTISGRFIYCWHKVNLIFQVFEWKSMYAAWPTKGRTGVAGEHMHPLAHMDSLLILNLRMLLTIIVYQSYASLFLFNINLVPMCAAWPTEGRAGVIGQHMHPLAHKDSFSILNF